MRFVLAILSIIPLTAGAAVYKCERPDGTMSYQGIPCATKEKSIKTPIGNSTGKNKINNTWELITNKDKMTDENTCIIQSPLFFVGSQGNDLIFSRLRLTKDNNENPIVGIYIDPVTGTELSAVSFHNDIHGLGARVDKNEFVKATVKASQNVLAFDLESSEKLTEQLKTGDYIATRLRFWPYDKTYDTIPQSLSDFNRAFRLLNDCIELNGTK
jgi:hypothetical protein